MKMQCKKLLHKGRIFWFLFCCLFSSNNFAESSNLFWAVKDGDIQTVLFLVENGADLNIKDSEGKTPLHYAFMKPGSEYEITRILCEHGAEVDAKDKDGKTPFMEAASRIAPDVGARRKAMEVLIQAGADVNAKTYKEGFFALYYGVYFLPEELVEFLVSSGAKINLGNNNKDTVLHLASFLRLNAKVKLFISLGGNLNRKNKEGQTPLMFAVLGGFKKPYTNLSTMLLLLQSGAKIDEKDGSGKTALVYAAKTGNVTLVWHLLRAGAKSKIKDNNGKSALDYAGQARFHGAAYYLAGQ